MSRHAYRSGGTRGGASQFNWDEVKGDKYRECYLGHSVKAAVGRWDSSALRGDLKRGNFSKADQDAAARAEVEALRQQDAEAMAEALGLTPPRRHGPGGGGGGGSGDNQLSAADMAQLTSRGQVDRDSYHFDAERAEGLGAAPSKTHDFAPQGRTAAERAVERQMMEQQGGGDGQEGAAGQGGGEDDGDRRQGHGGSGDQSYRDGSSRTMQRHGVSSGGAAEPADGKRARKERKAAEKAAKKAAKKQKKKEKKKEKKEKKKAKKKEKKKER
eukprot:g1997.t1